jgi:hypothetical protein
MAAVYNDLQVTSYIQGFITRFQHLEAQVALLSKQAGVPYTNPADSVPPEVLALVHAGDRLGAVTKLRELTGASFGDARDAIAAL